MALRTAYIDADFAPKHQEFPTVNPDDVLLAEINKAVRTSIGSIAGIPDEVDGETFTLTSGVTSVIFEVDFDGSVTGTNTPLDFRRLGDSAGDFHTPGSEAFKKLQITAKAIQASVLPIEASVDSSGQVLILRNVDIGATDGNKTITVSGGSVMVPTGMALAVNTFTSTNLLHIRPVTNEGHKLMIAWEA